MIRPVLTALFGLVLLAGCSAEPTRPEATDSEAVTAIVSHYPVEFLVDRIGGDLVDVQTLTAPGAEPHDLELSPQQVGDVQDADMVFYLSGFQPALDDAVGQAQGTVVDLTEGLPLRTSTNGETTNDPHVWLDPVLMGQMATTVADTLAAADPQHQQTFQANAEQLQADLAALDEQWQKGTKQCAVRTLVVSHEAFGYLADRYGFVQKGISGLTPETEPSAQALADLAEFVRDNGVTTVYTETLVSPAVAETVAAEAGAQTATLDPLEGPPAAGDYISAMQENLAVVEQGQSCS
ncbi:MAG: metal ABC transporter substrate-binding protein [Candidatus Nanopelagicales bacterium]